MSAELIALVGDHVVGRVRRLPQGRLSFTYDDMWRDSEEAYPLSLSMPLAAADHGATAIETFLWGLLPDNERVLDRWARKFQVSARDVFGLLSQVGEDCAGAVQFVRPERLDEIRSGVADKIEWLAEGDLAQRLRLLRQDHPPGGCQVTAVSSASPAPSQKRLCLSNGPPMILAIDIMSP